MVYNEDKEKTPVTGVLGTTFGGAALAAVTGLLDGIKDVLKSVRCLTEIMPVNGDTVAAKAAPKTATGERSRVLKKTGGWQ